jgi:hypothetical protein
MVEYKRLKRNLLVSNTQFIDRSTLSPNFFNITSIPLYFSAGKNGFKMKPNFTNLSQNYPIYIEVLDVNGNNVFHHVTTADEADGTKIISVYVYRTTAFGPGTITFVGTSNVDTELRSIPRNAIQQNNIKFVYTISIDKFKPNDNDIIFEENPDVSISERKYSIIEDRFNGDKQTVQTGSARYSLENGKPNLFSLGETFTENFVGATISFPNLSDNIQPSVLYETASFEYSASIKSVNNNYVMELDKKLRVIGIGGEYTEIVNAESQPYRLVYSQKPTAKNITQNNNNDNINDSNNNNTNKNNNNNNNTNTNNNNTN